MPHVRNRPPKAAVFLLASLIACTAAAQNTTTAPQIEAEFADLSQHDVLQQGIWAIWSDKTNFGPQDRQFVADKLDQVRAKAISDFGMKDPPNVAQGKAVNIYLHDPEKRDGFPDTWSNGVGTNSFDLPYMTLPKGAHLDAANLDHEGFHIFQYNANSPGFEYASDSGWYIETTAEWFAVKQDPTRADAYVTAGSIAGNPHLALWHGFDNARPSDPVHWMTETRQYGLHLWLAYLQRTTGLSDDVITGGFYKGLQMSPQEYLAKEVGLERHSAAWADFAGLMTAAFIEGPDSPMPEGLMTKAQRARAFVERDWALRDTPMPQIRNDLAFTLGQGEWMASSPALYPRPFGYNVVKLAPAAGDHRIDLKSDGALALRLVTRMGDRWEIAKITPGDTLSGIGPSSYLVVAAVAPVFKGDAPTPYQVRLTPIAK